MASKEQCDRYAAELHRRFDELTRWAVANWPKKDFPLLQSDFKESRRELSQIIGPKLGDADDDALPASRNDAPFIEVTPMPWP